MFQRKGSPEKQNAIHVQGTVKPQATVELKCSSCGTIIGTRKGVITVISGEMTIGINNSSKLLCNKCKEK